MNIIIIIFALSLLAFFVHIAISKKSRNKKKMIELLLLYQLVINMGVMCFVAFLAQSAIPEIVAARLQWPISPFQQEMANVNLGYSILGFMAIWFRGHMWTAIVVGSAIWLIGDAIHHLLYMLEMHTYSVSDLIALSFSDAITPIFMLVLLYFYLKTQKLGIKKRATQKSVVEK